MKTWQAALAQLGLMVAGATAPTVKNKTLQAALVTLAGGGTVIIQSMNSNTDPKGRKLKQQIDGSFKSQPKE